ncbi:unnamed protein product [Blepharisma stoltei]|uniref:Maturase K n=1 Tax=Blepharisma stoltei TaxID=1481888 RepID=A0AAU9KE98_9CILI|nr:unnamed protein product [Blepharisma stoltei]
MSLPNSDERYLRHRLSPGWSSHSFWLYRKKRRLLWHSLFRKIMYCHWHFHRLRYQMAFEWLYEQNQFERLDRIKIGYILVSLWHQLSSWRHYWRRLLELTMRIFQKIPSSRRLQLEFLRQMGVATHFLYGVLSLSHLSKVLL